MIEANNMRRREEKGTDWRAEGGKNVVCIVYFLYTVDKPTYYVFLWILVRIGGGGGVGSGRRMGGEGGKREREKMGGGCGKWKNGRNW